jgi:hypothetical protein
MSYDITFVPKTAGKTVEEIEGFLEDYDGAEVAPDKAWMKKARAVAASLIAMNPELEGLDEGTMIELAVAEDAKGFAIDVSMFPGEVTICAPFWYVDEAEELFSEMWRYARVICDKLEMVAYDSQAAVVWKSEDDALAGVDAYRDIASDSEE